jgi:formimidoylglutamate deiminase
MTRLRPELVWTGGRFQRGLEVAVDVGSGRIRSVAPVPGDPSAGSGPTPENAPGPAAHGEAGDDGVVALPGRALLPGFVNAHSHAFQRLIRGRTQTRPAGRDADFWSWREAMYGAALTLSPEDVHDVARLAFIEMIRTGITAVGEFHYLHHRPDGAPYPDPNELALRVMDAAEAAGIRIVLLHVCYATGGIGRPLEPRQRRFRADSLEEYLRRADRLQDAIERGRRPTATMGVAPHSLRAVPRDWLPALGRWAEDRDVPLHMHVAERPAEVDATVAEHGLRPVELLAEDGLLDPRLTAIHATHLTDAEVALLGGSGATVCACPTTERGLGDGFLRGLDLRSAGVPNAQGTDSHVNLDFLEEMRLVEYNERLRRLERVVITDGAPGDEEHHRVAPELLDMATVSGARSLRLDAGEIAPGRLADLVAIDLRHLSLAGWTDDSLAAMITLSATPDVVADVWVGGERRLDGRSHAGEAEAVEAFRGVAGG